MSRPLRKEREAYVSLPERGKPSKRPVRKRSFRLSGEKLPTLVALLILVYLAVSFGGQFSRLSSLQRDVNNIQQQVRELESKNSALRQELQLVKSDAYIEKTAREKLGLVKPGETRVVPVPPGTELKRIQAPDKDDFVGD